MQLIPLSSQNTVELTTTSPFLQHSRQGQHRSTFAKRKKRQSRSFSYTITCKRFTESETEPFPSRSLHPSIAGYCEPSVTRQTACVSIL
jgi:hypothetical protein